MSKLRAFMYHDIRDLKEKTYEKRYLLKSFLNCNQFEKQVEEIKKNHEIISCSDVLSKELNKSIDYAILTFDDGLKDHYSVAKYLFENNLTGTFLIPRMPVIEKKVMNTHKIQFILSVTDEKKLSEDILKNFDDDKSIWEQYSKTKWKNNWWSKEMIFVTNLLRNFNNGKLDNYELTDFYFKKYVTSDEVGFAEEFYLSEREIQEMRQMNMTIGGHGDISENLINIDDYEKEIKKSKDFISQFTEELVFSYPNGGFNEEIKDKMQEYDFTISFTTIPKTLTELDDIDFLEFPRYDAPQKIKFT